MVTDQPPRPDRERACGGEAVDCNEAVDRNPAAGPEVWLQRLQQLEAQGHLAEAVAAAARARQQWPACAPLQCYGGWLLHRAGDADSALAALQTALALQPNLTLAHVRAGVVLRDLGRVQEAEQATRRALALDPTLAGCQMNLAVILRESGRLRQALDAIEAALRLDPGLPGVQLNHASVLRDLGQPQQALAVVEQALAAQGPTAPLLALQGSLLQALGRLAEAEQALRRALALDSGCAAAYVALLQQLKPAPDDPLLAQLAAATQGELPVGDRCDLWFARAKLEHDQRRYEAAARSLEEANALRRRLRPSNAASLIAHGEELLALFAQAQAEWPVAAHHSDAAALPGTGCIFVVGMPRSGSTLVESILSMRPDCEALGETDLFPVAFRRAAQLAAAVRGAASWRLLAHRAASGYLEARAAAAGAGVRWSTDKLLSNYNYCGHLLRALPGARVIHCSRQPLDVLLSSYRANFSTGMGYAGCLVDGARVYAAQERLMATYRQAFPEQIRVVRYEELVADPGEQVRQLVAWLGWPWDGRYLESHRNERAVSTASLIQVRAPIHAGSVGNWQRYSAMLEPARQELERLGVAVA